MNRIIQTSLALLLAALTLAGCARAPEATPVPETAAPELAAQATPVPETAAPRIAFDAPSGALTEADLAARLPSGDGAAWLFAVNVGKGDALVLRAGGYTALIDTGRANARGKVLSALAALGVGALDGVFLTHTDKDHAGGLAWLAESDIPVGTWYASALYTGVKAKKHPAALAAAARGAEVRWLMRGDAVALGDSGATLRVLAPENLYDDDDDNSLVMLLECGAGRMLLTGDMESAEEADLLAAGDDLRCDVLKVPNHGDGDATGEALARACAAKVAVISTDGEEKPGTPDPDVVARLTAAGGAVISTESAGLGILVTLENGEAAFERVDIGAPMADGLILADVDVSDERIALKNGGGAAVDLAGWTLFSERGGEWYAFPDGTMIGAGEALTVGTRATEGDFDLLWDDKNVLSNGKSDPVCLYDPFGRLADRWEA